MRPLVRLGARLLVLVVLLQLLFVGLLVVGAAVPDKPIVDRLSADARSGAYGPSGQPDGQGGRATSFTDCVAAGTGLGLPTTSAFDRAIRMPRLESCTEGTRQLVTLHRGQRVDHPQEYFRYWAGYTVLTRPVLALGGMDAMRLVAGGLFGLALLTMAMTLSRALGTPYTLALLAPLLLSSNVLTVPANAFSHAISLAVIFGGVAFVTWAAARERGWSVLYAVAASAAVFNFVDLLTTPTIPLALTAAVTAALAYRRTASVRDALVTGVTVSAVWTVAYVVTWVSRWLITAVFLGWRHTMDVVTNIAKFRIDGDFGTVSHTFGAAVLKNGRTWLAVPVMPELVLGAALVAVVVSLALAWRRFGPGRLLAAAVLAAPSLIAVVWMLVLSNHSQIHDIFVYRNVPTSIGIAVAACVLAAGTRPGTSGLENPRTSFTLVP
ncbi:hypothetical protein KRR39_12805 [Nocardioides panacis]|uniref:Uncharacterized protein n=1 Tax=Nocardioides panacis TaxID=2849501 RepID=A0A975SV45_9ACTN|nr:hypothetical protein [Nocardioides panacis]QWZ06467.1 hypothetical protein KRR39_12805 [Nocardioides panacis]